MRAKMIGMLVVGSTLLWGSEVQNQSWLEGSSSQQQYDLLEKKPLTEATLLMQLDKEGRVKFRALAPEGKRLALELANRSAIRSPQEAVDLAEKERAQRQQDNQSRMLHNGMDRIRRSD